MKYIVMLGTERFEIPDGTTAIGFVELALKYFVPTEYSKELKPLISIENEKKNDNKTNNDSGVACIDCKYYDGSGYYVGDGYCVKNETTVYARGTCEAAERW